MAVNVEAVATPVAFVVAAAVVDPPANVPPGPVPGATKVTVIPLTGLLLESLTVAASAVPKLVFTDVLCGVPAVAVMLAGVWAFTVNVNIVV